MIFQRINHKSFKSKWMIIRVGVLSSEHDRNCESCIFKWLWTYKYCIFFLPKADGINDFTYQNYNDCEAIRKIHCNVVVNPGGTVFNPIGCPR